MRKDIHCTIGGVELLREEVEMMYSQKLYIVAYTGVYQILFSQAQDRYHGQKVADEFEGIFGIKFSKVHDKLMSVVFRLVIIDIFAFDDWLHEKYGNYEEEGKSMRDIVTEHYGEKGMKMILNLIG